MRAPPVIALDASNFMLEYRSGIKRYLAGLIPALARSAPDLRFEAWMGYLKPVHGEGRPAWKEPNVRNVAVRIPRRFIERAWRRGILPAEWVAPRAGVFHSFWLHLPPARRCKRVITMFDLREVMFPEMYPGISAKVRALLDRNLAAADIIVASSRATAGDLRARFALGDRPIEVIPGAVEESFRPRPEGEVRAARERHGIAGPYAVAMGAGDPRKNMPWLVRAFARYLRETGDDLRLAIAGTLHADAWTAVGDVVRAGLGDRIRPIGPVSDEDWMALLTAAEALVYPSIYEGFGLPPLEAMACGAPVVASAIPPLEEWFGGAFLPFSPRDEASLAGALRQLRGSADFRGRLREVGAATVRRFTWDRPAAAHAAIYRKLLEGAV